MPNPLVRSVKAVCLREFRLSWKHWLLFHPGVASACQSSDANSIRKQWCHGCWSVSPRVLGEFTPAYGGVNCAGDSSFNAKGRPEDR